MPAIRPVDWIPARPGDLAPGRVRLLDQPRLPTFIQNVFRAGDALLLIDGYDELTPENQQVVTEYFKIILQNYPTTRIVTSGAPEYLDGLIPLGFAPLPLMTWSNREN